VIYIIANHMTVLSGLATERVRIVSREGVGVTDPVFPVGQNVR